MTGRWPDMDAVQAPSRGPRAGRVPRLICIAVGLFCTLGILSGAALRSSEHSHHRIHAVAAAGVVIVGATTVRDDLHAVAASPPPLTSDTTRVSADSSATTPVHTTDHYSVRTRGPPSA
jgi:hypothetical protein